jgi:hypothetical protein
MTHTYALMSSTGLPTARLLDYSLAPSALLCLH